MSQTIGSSGASREWRVACPYVYVHVHAYVYVFLIDVTFCMVGAVAVMAAVRSTGATRKVLKREKRREEKTGIRDKEVISDSNASRLVMPAGLS